MIVKILIYINNYRLEHATDPSRVLRYCKEDLARDINCSLATMSRLCNRDPITGCPKQYPTRHLIVKIIVVAVLPPELVDELLGSVGYAINPSREDEEYVRIYHSLINQTRPIPKTRLDAAKTTREINALLSKAVDKGAPHRDAPTISSVFYVEEYRS